MKMQSEADKHCTLINCKTIDCKFISSAAMFKQCNYSTTMSNAAPNRAVINSTTTLAAQP